MRSQDALTLLQHQLKWQGNVFASGRQFEGTYYGVVVQTDASTSDGAITAGNMTITIPNLSGAQVWGPLPYPGTASPPIGTICTLTFNTNNTPIVHSFINFGGGGAQGAQGPQGYQGNQGPQGTQGSAGAQGAQGPQGYQGDQGAQGAQGAQGLTGSQGTQGATGTQGPQGYQGSAGAQGAQGPQGYQGNQGAQGAQGGAATVNAGTTTTVPFTTGASITNVGTQSAAVFNFSLPQGPQGYQGYQGYQGLQGYQGVIGYGYSFNATNSYAPALGSAVFINTATGSYSLTAFNFAVGGRVRLVAASSTSVYVEGINTGPTGGFGNNTNVTVDTISPAAVGAVGVSTTITSTTLSQSSYTWVANAWVGAVVLVGTTLATVTSNTTTTLTFASWSSTTPANASPYSILFSSWNMSVAGNIGLQGNQGSPGTGNMPTLTYDPASIAQQIVGTTASQNVSNKTILSSRITKRVLSLSANSATPAINTDSYDVVHITAQTSSITSFTTNLTGTPVDGDTLRISIAGTTAIPLTWGTKFESSTATLPSTTVSTTRLDVGFFWNTETSKWRCVATA